MQITKSGQKIILKDLKFIEILSLLKIQTPLDILFAGVNSEINHGLTIRLGYRKITKVTATTSILGENGNETTTSTIEEIIEDIAKYIKEFDVVVAIQLDQKDFKINEELISYVGKYNEELIKSCSFITYTETEDCYMICYPQLKNGDSNILYFYASNNSMLSFGKDGPRLYTDNEKISSITDILCK